MLVMLMRIFMSGSDEFEFGAFGTHRLIDVTARVRMSGARFVIWKTTCADELLIVELKVPVPVSACGLPEGVFPSALQLQYWVSEKFPETTIAGARCGRVEKSTTAVIVIPSGPLDVSDLATAFDSPV